MYFNSYVDTYEKETTTNKYGDKVSTISFLERIPCVILEASFEDMQTTNQRIVKLIAGKKIYRGTVFKYDGDNFEVKKYRKAKEYHVMYAELMSDVF